MNALNYRHNIFSESFQLKQNHKWFVTFMHVQFQMMLSDIIRHMGTIGEKRAILISYAVTKCYIWSHLVQIGRDSLRVHWRGTELYIVKWNALYRTGSYQLSEVNTFNQRHRQKIDFWWILYYVKQTNCAHTHQTICLQTCQSTSHDMID